MFSSIQSLKNKFEKRDAVRLKVANIIGHKFVITALKEFTYCSQCDELIWLMGHECKLCKLISHYKCSKLIDFQCRGQKEKREASSHQFLREKFMPWNPTFCKHCGILIKGWVGYGSGYKCSAESGGCGLTVHLDCKDHADPRCRVRVAGCHKSRAQEGSWRSKVQIRDFELMRLLGHGTFSKVYLARLKANGRKFAIKVVRKTNIIMQSDPESAFTEREILDIGKRCPFIAVAHCYFQTEERLFYVMEYVEGRNLVDHLDPERSGGRFDENRTRFHVAEIVLALKFLHELGFVHRDIKLDNIILDAGGHCKLLDFGLSKDLKKSTTMKTRTFLGTPEYISPEIIKEQDYDFSTDWWSLGVLMYEMLCGFSPFYHKNSDLLYESIVRDEVKFPRSPKLSHEAESIIRGFLTKEPEHRLGCQNEEGGVKAIMNHSFFSYSLRDWADIWLQRMRPPYVPEIDDLPDEQDNILLSPILSDDRKALDELSQEDFEGFSTKSGSLNSMFKL